MARQIAHRVLAALIVVWGVTLITFLIARVLPGNPVYLIVGQTADDRTIAAATERLGLDKGIFVQYALYMRDLVTGDLGTAWTTSNPVTTDLAQRVPATLELAVAALVLALAIAVPMGIAAALRPRGILARVADVVSAAGAALPQFWLGLMLIYVFFFLLGWFPPPLGRFPPGAQPESITGFLLIDTLLHGDIEAWWQALRALALPAVTLAIAIQPPLLRLVQVSMGDALDSDAVRTARAIGLSRRQVIYGDALRLTLLPLLTMIAVVFGILLSSSVLVEAVFAWPGIGQYAVQAINASDYAAIQGVVLVAAAAYVLLYLILDLVQALVDPRLRTS